jgi:hypothetical protein
MLAELDRGSWGAVIAGVSVGAKVRIPISASPAARSAPVGVIVPVTGRAPYIPQGCQVRLQRLRGSRGWHTVGVARVRPSARFTLAAQPPRRGSHSYRALLASCGRFVASATRPFVITGR